MTVNDKIDLKQKGRDALKINECGTYTVINDMIFFQTIVRKKYKG
jgi:hypothetical protein